MTLEHYLNRQPTHEYKFTQPTPNFNITLRTYSYSTNRCIERMGQLYPHIKDLTYDLSEYIKTPINIQFQDSYKRNIIDAIRGKQPDWSKTRDSRDSNRYRINGVYRPNASNPDIFVSLYRPGALTHEMGHALDFAEYFTKGTTYSQEVLFQDLAKQYREKLLSSYNEDFLNAGKLYKEFPENYPEYKSIAETIDYDTSNLEIFANTFNAWYDRLVKPGIMYKNANTYGYVDKVANDPELQKPIDKYFSHRFANIRTKIDRRNRANQLPQELTPTKQTLPTLTLDDLEDLQMVTPVGEKQPIDFSMAKIQQTTQKQSIPTLTSDMLNDLGENTIIR